MTATMRCLNENEARLQRIVRVSMRVSRRAMDGDEVLSVELASWMVVRGCGRGVRHSRARARDRATSFGFGFGAFLSRSRD